MSTAGDQINGALRLIGQLAEGEVPSADTSADALVAFNQMLDSWSIDRLAIYSTQDQTFNWAANIDAYTFGPTGDIVAERPVSIDDSSYFNYNNRSYGLAIINQEQYNAIALKSSTSTWPQLLWINMEMPDITLTVWPVPTAQIEMHIVSVTQLSQASSLSTSLVIPPGYLRAFRFNLACELASEFGVAPPPQVAKIAALSLRSVKRINNPNDLMSMPSAIVTQTPRYNVFSGQPY